MKKFTVVDTDSQRTVVIESNAQTLGDLKEELMAQGFDLTDKTIQEGLTRTVLVDDESLLPHDVVRNGVTTNNLVFRLTRTGKNIKSGVTSRNDLYEFIRENSLAGEILQVFGKSYTNLPNEVLNDFIEGKLREGKKEEETGDCPFVNVMAALLKELYEVGAISKELRNYCMNELGRATSSNGSVYSKDEIEDMFAGM